MNDGVNDGGAGRALKFEACEKDGAPAYRVPYAGTGSMGCARGRNWHTRPLLAKTTLVSKDDAG